MEIDGFGKKVPPLKGHVIVYFIQKGFTASEALDFFNYYQDRAWMSVRNQRVLNWKVVAWRWILKLISH